MRLLVIAATAALLIACASTPSPTPKAPPPPVAAAPASAPAAQPLAAIDATNIVAAQKAGYKIVNDKGKRMYCRRESVTGTRLKEKTTCLTAEALQQQQDEAREMMAPRPAPYEPPGSK